MCNMVAWNRTVFSIPGNIFARNKVASNSLDTLRDIVAGNIVAQCIVGLCLIQLTSVIVIANRNPLVDSPNYVYRLLCKAVLFLSEFFCLCMINSLISFDDVFLIFQWVVHRLISLSCLSIWTKSWTVIYFFTLSSSTVFCYC